MALDKVSKATDDPNDQYGKETVCECGERFHSDKWSLFEELECYGEEFEVSTVALTIPHGLDKNEWYETLVRFDGGERIVERYHTEKQAEEGHERIIRLLKEGEFEFETRRCGIDIG
jgi:hypothetical protein